MRASTAPKPVSGAHWPLLDTIRFGAALLVLFGHARGLLLEGIARVEYPSIFIRAFYFISGLQHEGVVMFFVVSGFLVGGSAWRMIEANQFKFNVYFINRFARIYIVLVPAIALVLVINLVGTNFLLDTRFYGTRPLFPSAVSDGWSWGQIPCHLFCLQGLLCEPWGADPPLWSLGYEWALYVVGPAIFVALASPGLQRRQLLTLVLAGAVFAALTWRTTDWPQWFAFWILGAIAARCFAKQAIGLPVALVGAFACGVGLVLSRLAVLPPLATDVLVAGGLALAASSQALMRWSFGEVLTRRGAGFSYSLYLIHLPVCIFIGALFERFAHWPGGLVQPDSAGILGFICMVTLALIAAHAFAHFTEQHTALLRKWLLQRFSSAEWRAQAKPPPAASFGQAADRE
jgi:peptidoglycan/LPS O-acetylase OafA/YrhL